MIEFPRNFLWGAATSAYQVEGNNINSDWWTWEKESGLKEVSGLACRHYELYRRDFDLARSLGHNAHRISIEWSRIEPEEGKFSSLELDHYADVVLYLRQCSLEPIVTLHHLTNPWWFARLGGWENPKSSDYFLRFVDKVIQRLATGVRYWITINEPLVYIYHAYILGNWPPQAKSPLKAIVVYGNLATGHIKAYNLIHRFYRAQKLPSPLVSIAKNMPAFVPCRANLKDKFSVYLRNRIFNFNLLDKLARYKSLDFIGVNYYSRTLVEVKNWSPHSLLMDNCTGNHHPLPRNSLGWDIYPEGLYELLSKLKSYGLPILISENGICTDDDNQRWGYITKHLENLHRAIKDGVNVIGYLHWSLLDNYEWDKGFGPRFGLVEVDYTTYERLPRESAKRFCAVCKTGKLE